MNHFVSSEPSVATYDSPLASAIQYGSTAATEFKPGPIEPSWILEGNPVARSLCLAQAADGHFSCGLWDCTAGTFDFIYRCDEIVHILEGEARVEHGGTVKVLRAGDVALFPHGVTARWTVPHYVRKYAIFRSVHRSLWRRIASRVRRVLRSFGV